jgi:hypothetical protein
MRGRFIEEYLNTEIKQVLKRAGHRDISYRQE